MDLLEYLSFATALLVPEAGNAKDGSWMDGWANSTAETGFENFFLEQVAERSHLLLVAILDGVETRIAMAFAFFIQTLAAARHGVGWRFQL